MNTIKYIRQSNKNLANTIRLDGSSNFISEPIFIRAMYNIENARVDMAPVHKAAYKMTGGDIANAIMIVNQAAQFFRKDEDLLCLQEKYDRLKAITGYTNMQIAVIIYNIVNYGLVKDRYIIDSPVLFGTPSPGLCRIVSETATLYCWAKDKKIFSYTDWQHLLARVFTLDAIYDYDNLSQFKAGLQEHIEDGAIGVVESYRLREKCSKQEIAKEFSHY